MDARNRLERVVMNPGFFRRLSDLWADPVDLES